MAHTDWLTASPLWAFGKRVLRRITVTVPEHVSENMRINVGTSGYGYKEWKRKFYPEKISSKEMLRFYSKHLGAVEINNTFYHMPTERVLLSWAEQVPDHFVLAFKAPHLITHLKRLRGVVEETDYLFRTLSVIDTKLGPVLFQFPKSFRVDRTALGQFLGLIPRSISCAFEFRHRSWLDVEILNLLRGGGCSLCFTDADESPASEIVNTATWGYLRLRRSYYTDAELALWEERIVSMRWDRAFVFFKHEEEADGPETAIRFRKLTESRAKKSQSKKDNETKR